MSLSEGDPGGPSGSLYFRLR